MSWYHQVAINTLVGSFMLKEKLLAQKEIPLLSAWDIVDLLVFKFHKEMSDEALEEKHRKRQMDINAYYSS